MQFASFHNIEAWSAVRVLTWCLPYRLKQESRRIEVFYTIKFSILSNILHCFVDLISILK